MTITGNQNPLHFPKVELRWIMVFFLFICFFFFDGHSLFRSIEGGTSLEKASMRIQEGRIERRISLLFLFGFGMVSLFLKQGKPLNINGIVGWIILLFFTWIFFSLAWAEDAILVFRRLVVLIMISLSGLAVARRFSIHEIIFLIFWIASGFLILGLIMEVILGAFQPFSSDYRLAGTTHSNHLGINCFLILISGAVLLERMRNIRSLFIIIIGIAFIALILTKSRTSFASAVLTLLFYGYMITPDSRKLVIILYATFAFCIIILTFGDTLVPVFQKILFLGRESDPNSAMTLTGRVPLWMDCIEFISQRPFTGYGYNGFWTPGHISKISSWNGWAIAESHSGYIELVLGVGLIGAVIYVVMILGGLRRAFILKRYSPGHIFFIIVLIFGLSEGLLESAMVVPNFLFFVTTIVLANLGFVEEPILNRQHSYFNA